MRNKKHKKWKDLTRRDIHTKRGKDYEKRFNKNFPGRDPWKFLFKYGP